jgi:hypothetical protein
MPTLFEIGDDLRALDELIEERGGDVTDPEVMAAVERWYAEVAADEAAKLEAYVQYLRQLDMEIDAAADEEKQFAAKRRSREARKDWLRQRLKLYLEATGRKSVKTSAGRTVSVQANGGRPPVDVTAPPEDIPDEFCRVRREVDHDAVRAALDAGQALPFARFRERGTQLRIR